MTGTTPTVKFLPGEATAVVGRRICALVVDDPSGTIVSTLSESIESTTVEHDAIFRELIASGLLDVTGFGLLIVGDEITRIVVRGTVGAEVLVGAAPVEVEAKGLLTFNEMVVPTGSTICLRVIGSNLSHFDESPYVAALGVLPSSGVYVRWDSQDATFESIESSVAASGVEMGETGGVSDLDDRPPVADEVEPPVRLSDADPGEQSNEMFGESPVDSGSGMEGEFDEERTVIGLDLADSLSEEPFDGAEDRSVTNDANVDDEGSPEPTAVESDVDGVYDDLFGATQIRSVEQAAVRPSDHAHESDRSDRSNNSVDGDPLSHPGAQAEDDVDHDGRTISIDELNAMRARGAQVPPLIGTGKVPGATDGPLVLSCLCPIGHPSPPHLSHCRVCGAPIPTQEAQPVPRPPLGLLVFSTGERILISGNIIVGRSPRVIGPAPDGRPPELVRVPSPNNDVSRTHLEITVEEWQVAVVDLKSANGTTVTVPGRQLQRLRPHEPVIITTGARIQLAGEIEIVMEEVR